MFAASFDYYRAGSIGEAHQLLREHAGAKLLAGGHSLIPLMKMRLATPTALVDIGRIRGSERDLDERRLAADRIADDARRAGVVAGIEVRAARCWRRRPR